MSTPSPRTRQALALILVLSATACGGGSGGSFQDAVKEVYAPCAGDEIKLMAAKHDVQLAFTPCGSNNFLHFGWAPDGHHLYYQTNNGPWVMSGATRDNLPLRASIPVTNAVWFNDEMLAYGAEGQRGWNIEVYNIARRAVNIVPTDLGRPRRLQRGAEADEVLVLASGDGSSPRRLWSLRVNTGELNPVFDWLSGQVLDFEYRHDADLMVYKTAAEVAGEEPVLRLARASTGETLRTFTGRTRASISLDGRFLVSEGPGAAIPIFHQLTDEERAAGAEASAQGAEVPSYLPREVEPPAMWFLDLESGQEVLFEGVYGDDFIWYDHTPYYGSFRLWGIEDKEYNRNVAFVDMRNAMRRMGIEVPLMADWGVVVERSEEETP